VFSFAGPAPLGGERTGVEAVREWFQRLFSYFPGIQFTVQQVIVQGWPWNTLVATRLSIAAPRADGSVYRNEAMQFLRLRWGKVVEDRLHEDTYKLANELQERQELSHLGAFRGETTSPVPEVQGMGRGHTIVISGQYNAEGESA
jgi:ketosteroid isomerase-like protein